MKRLRRRTGDPESDDPLAGVANFFDLGIVFGLGFLLALLRNTSLPGAVAQDRALPLERFQESYEKLEGSGVRLGMAYRLASGEVVYVPEQGR